MAGSVTPQKAEMAAAIPKDLRSFFFDLMATAMHLLRGTPYIYMGEELGMIDPAYTQMSDYVDVEAHNAYQRLLRTGKTPAEAFAIVHSKARDNSRVPMHWDASKYAGFSTVKPWLMPTDQAQINVQAELATGAIYPYYQALIKLRKQEPLVSAGHFAPLLLTDPQVWAYERWLAEQPEKLLVLNNFYGTATTIAVPAAWRGKAVTKVLGNYPTIVDQLGTQLTLQPYESLVLKG